MAKKNENQNDSDDIIENINSMDKKIIKENQKQNSNKNKGTSNDLISKYNQSIIQDTSEKPIQLVMEGQYKEVYNYMMDAYHANLTCGLVGPVGCGKTAIGRYFAQELNRPFRWITFSDAIRPAHLLGSLDPTIVFQKGFSIDAFNFGPFTEAALLGAVFLANEVNRGDEFVLNLFLDPLEEKRLYIPSLKQWIKMDPNFYFIATMNPEESRATRKLPEAFKSRISVWLELDYPEPSLEKKILTLNVKDLNAPIPASDAESIVNIINELRRLQKNDYVETPPSLRQGISILRLAIKRSETRQKQGIDRVILRDCAETVLLNSIEFSSNVSNKESYLRNIIQKHL